MKRLLINITAAFAAVLLVSACGGGGGGGGGGGTPILALQMETCLDGSTALRGLCRKTCKDGSTVPQHWECLKRCPNHRLVGEDEICMQTCPNGESRLVTESCEFVTREYGRNYGLSAIKAEYAYQQGHFGEGATVAVVDTGVRVTHNDLKDNIISGRDFVFSDRSNAITDPGNHGTPVAGIIAAVRNSIGMHGVAPSAKIMPLKIGDDKGLLTGNTRAAFRHAGEHGAHIVNNSYGRSFEMQGVFRGTLYRAAIPYTYYKRSLGNGRIDSQNALSDIGNADMVMVWSAGNAGWQSATGSVYICADLTVRFASRCTSGKGQYVARSDFIDRYVSQDWQDINDNSRSGIGVLSTVQAINRTFSGYEALWPFYAASESAYRDASDGDWTELRADPNFIAMTSRWLVVVALDRNNRIASYSNGCGNVSEWCLAAPATSTRGTSASDNDSIRYFSGTSAAAPHVAGALALLKSAGLEMSMTLHRSVLLRTADRTGHLINRELYGAGLVNVSAAISMVIRRRTPTMGGLFPSYSPSELGDMLPSEFAHLGDKVGNAEIAVKLDDGFYYNAPLSKLLYPTAKAKTTIGNINAEMTAAIITATASGFAAAGDNETAFALRWNGLGENTALFAEYMQRDYESGAWEKSTGGKIRLRRNLLGGFSAFGEYERKHLQSDNSAGKFLVGTENAQADGWTAGMQWIADSQRNRRFRVWTKERMRLSGGNLLLRYPHYDGDLQVREMRIPLNEKRERIWSAGYAADWGDNGEWTATAAYNDNTGEKKLSARWDWELR